MTKKTYSNKGAQKKSSKSLVVLGIAVAVVIAGGVGAYLATLGGGTGTSSTSSAIGSWHDVHGVGMSGSGDDSSLYLATHTGLFKKDNNSGWTPTGSDRSDFMGFVISPARDGTMYSSGHPVGGGNLGFRKSTDSGLTWQSISTVTTPPADFHAIDASAVDENLIYGAPGGGDNIYRTNDEGKTWTRLSPPDTVVSLAAHPVDAKVVYAGTVSGLYISEDQGSTWQKAGSDTMQGVVTGLGFSDEKTLYAFLILEEGDGYIVKSIDEGNTFEKTEGQIAGAKAAWKFAIGRSDEVYTIVNQNAPTGTAASVYRSGDGGLSWILEGTNNKAVSE